MTTSRVPLATAAILAALIFVQYVVGLLLNNVLATVTGEFQDPGQFWQLLAPAGLLPALLQDAAFGIGVFVSLRFVKPVTAEDGWARVIRRGVIAALLGAAAVAVFGVIEAVISAANPGTYPFGYSFSSTINVPAIPQALLYYLQPVPALFIDRIVPVVLAFVLLRVWLARQATVLTAPASLSGKP